MAQIAETQDSSEGGRRVVYDFAEERRHFEHEATRLHAIAKESRGRTLTTAQAAWRKFVLQLNPAADSRRSVKQMIEDNERRNKNNAEQNKEKKDPAASQGGDPTRYDPRKWRSRTESMRQVLIYGEADNGISRNRWLDRVKMSLRVDVYHDYRMPEGSAKKQDDTRKSPKKRYSSGPSRWSTVIGNSLFGKDEDIDPLAINLLPPLSFMSPVQKHGLKEHLEQQATLAVKKHRRALIRMQTQSTTSPGINGEASTESLGLSASGQASSSGQRGSKAIYRQPSGSLRQRPSTTGRASQVESVRFRNSIVGRGSIVRPMTSDSQERRGTSPFAEQQAAGSPQKRRGTSTGAEQQAAESPQERRGTSTGAEQQASGDSVDPQQRQVRHARVLRDSLLTARPSTAGPNAELMAARVRQSMSTRGSFNRAFDQ
jgi:hypothetical protein